MDRLSELVNLASFGEFNKIRDTWYLLGSFEVNSKTKAYIKGTIVKVNTGTNKGLDGCIIYVKENYLVGGAYGAVDWDTLAKDSIEQYAITVNGTLTPAFYVLLTKDEVDSIEEPIDENYQPFATETKKKSFEPTDTEIIIDDTNLQLIMSEIGVPFLSFDEVEYSRETICNMCVLPALRRYYREKPIIKRETKGPYAACQVVKFELPKNCTGIRRAEFRQGGQMSEGGFTSAKAFAIEQYMIGGGPQGGRFGRGVRYNKPVPGYTGIGAAGSTQSLAMMQRAAQQAVSNYYKRVRFNIEKLPDGRKIASGYTSIGGSLDIEFKYWSPDFSLVDFDDLEIVIKHAKSYVMRNIGALRTLVKTDTPGALDVSGFQNRAQTLEDEVNKYYNERPKVAVLRGEA